MSNNQPTLWSLDDKVKQMHQDMASAKAHHAELANTLRELYKHESIPAQATLMPVLMQYKMAHDEYNRAISQYYAYQRAYWLYMEDAFTGKKP